MSRIIDYTDRSTCILFGDGAGAFLLEPSTDLATEGGYFIGHINEIDGAGAPFLNMPAGGSRLPASAETVAKRQHYVKQEGQQVFKYAVKKMAELSETLLAKHGVSPDQVQLLIPHQANRRIITATAERLGMPLERVMINLDKYGNTTAATIPLAAKDAIAEGRLKKGRSGFICGGRCGIHGRRQFVALGILAASTSPCLSRPAASYIPAERE